MICEYAKALHGRPSSEPAEPEGRAFACPCACPCGPAPARSCSRSGLESCRAPSSFASTVTSTSWPTVIVRPLPHRTAPPPRPGLIIGRHDDRCETGAPRGRFQKHLAPVVDLARRHLMLPRHRPHRDPRPARLLHDPQLLRVAPTPTAPNFHNLHAANRHDLTVRIAGHTTGS